MFKLNKRSVIALFIVTVAIPNAYANSITERYSPEQYQDLVEIAYKKFKTVTEGENATYIPALANVPSELFGVVIALRDGSIFAAGDVDYAFSDQSLSKPFTLALLMQQYGGQQIVIDKIGVEPTGLPFNSKLAIEILKDRSVNPMVTAGALAAVSLVKANDEDERWHLVHDNLNDFAGSPLKLMEKVYDSEYATAWSNRGIANTLFNYGRLYSAPEEALRVYTKQCSVGVTTRQLAIMGATLANEGINPTSGKRLIDKKYIPKLLAIMLTAGLYDESGRWSMQTGLPSKSGVSGGIMSVVPGVMAIAAFSPRVNKSGNSVRAQMAIEYIASKLGVGIFGPNSNESNS
jgi:glutaminase